MLLTYSVWLLSKIRKMLYPAKAPGRQRDEPDGLSLHEPVFCSLPFSLAAPCDSLALIFPPIPEKRKRVLIQWRIKHQTKIACGHVDTFFLLARMRLRTASLTCCLWEWRLYQRWIVTAAWFTCWMNLQTQNNCCDSRPSSTTAG